jgi:colanic acid/amylovoran biosynthesis glycosyltransferase
VNLRIAYMTGEYFRVSHTFIRREAAMLRALGHHVQSISIRPPRPGENLGPEAEAEKFSAIILLPASPFALIAAHLSQLVASPARYFSALALAFRTRKSFFSAIAYFAESALLARRMRQEKLTHLHNHFSSSSCSVAMLAAQMGGFAFSFTVHGPAEFFEAAAWRLDEKVRRALFVNCISWFCRSQVMVFAAPADWPKLHIVHCGVDPAQFPPRREIAAGTNLLFIGRLAAAKGLPILLEAMTKLPNATLTIAGDGPDRRLLESQSQQLSLAARVRFAGYQTPDQIRALLAQADLFVMTSFAEGVPVVLMEAMAAGVPVIATRIAGIPELIADGQSGLLVPPGDADSTARAIASLLNDPALRSRFAAAARATVEKDFNLHTESRWLNTILTSALSGNPVAIRPEEDASKNPRAAEFSVEAPRP